MDERIDIVVDSSSAKRGIDILVDSFKSLRTSAASAESATTKLFDKMSSGLRGLESALFTLRNVMLSFTVVITTFKQLGDEFSKFQAFISAMSVSVGGVASARKEFAWLMKLADELGVSINALSHNYSQLSAAAANTTMTQDKLRDVFETFSIASRVLHLSTADTRLMFYALTQMVSKGVVSMEELRRQLGEKLPGAMNLAARSVNASMQEFETAVRKGTVDSAKFLPIFAEEVKRAFGPGITLAQKAYDAEVNRLTNSLQKLIVVMYDVGVADAFTNVIRELNRILSDPAIGNELAKALKAVADNATDFLKTITPEKVNAFINGFTGALTTMSQVITQDVLPVVEKLGSYLATIAAVWLTVKGMGAGATVGTAVAGPAGTIPGALAGGTAGFLAFVGAQRSLTSGARERAAAERYRQDPQINKSGYIRNVFNPMNDPMNFQPDLFTGGSHPKYSLKDVTRESDKGKEAEMNKYIQALQTLEQQLGKLNLQTVEQRTQYQITEGTLKSLTKPHKDHLIAVAKEVDLKLQLNQASQVYLEYAKQWEAQEDANGAVVASFNTSMSQQLKDLEHEISLLQMEEPLATSGLMNKRDEIRLVNELNFARDLSNGLRKIDLDLERAKLALGPASTTNYEQAITDLENLAAAQRDALPDALRRRADAKLASELTRNQVDEFNNLWRTVESTGKTVFTNLFSKGKSAFEGIGDAIKASIIDLLYQLTLRPFIIKVGLSVANALGVGGGGLGSSGGFGLGDILSLGKNFGGGGSALFGSNIMGIGQVGGLLGGSAGLTGSAVAGEIAMLTGSGVATSGVATGMSGLMSGLGTALPWVGGALAIGSMLGLFGEGGGPKEQTAWWRYGGGNNLGIGDENITSQDPAYYAAAAALTQRLHQEYGAEMLATVPTMSVTSAPGSDPFQMLSRLEAQIRSTLAPAKQLADQTAQLRESLRAAQDPMGYWAAKLRELQTYLGSSATTIEAWRAEFLVALEGSLTQEEVNKWNEFGEAINQSTSAMARALNISTDLFASLVDYNRYVRRSAVGSSVAGLIPGFAGGVDNFGGGLAVVGESGPELLDLPAGSSVASNSSSRSMISDLVAEIRALREDQRAGHMAIARNTAQSARLHKRWDDNGLYVRGAEPDQPLETNVVQSVPVPTS